MPSVNDALEAINNEWSTIAPTLEPDSITQAPLWINDISLPNGGKFSISSKWEHVKHQFHRVGRDVDIRTKKLAESWKPVAVLIAEEGVVYRDKNGQERTKRGNGDFEEVVEEHGGIPDIHAKGNDDEHYHMYFYGD